MLHAKLSITRDHTDPVSSCFYKKGERYDVAEDAAIRIVGAGAADLVEVPPQYDADERVDADDDAIDKCEQRIAAAAPAIAPPVDDAAGVEKED